MKTLALALVAVVALPGLALAHGGHPEAGDFHFLAHLLYFGVPAAAVGLSALILRKRNR